jgi:hypothetical protein
MFRKKGRIFFGVILAGFLVWLIIINIQNHSRIKALNIKLNSLTIELSQSLSNVSALRADSSKKVQLLTLLRKTVEHAEAANDSLTLAIEAVNARLSNELANVTELKKKIAFLNNELDAQKSVIEKTEQLAANLQNDFNEATNKAENLSSELDIERRKVRNIEPELKSQLAEMEHLRRSFAPRIGVYASCINTPDCQELYRAIKPSMPKVCDAQLRMLYSDDGKNLRSISRKLNCPDLENLYLFLISAGLNPKSATIEEVREPFRQTILSGDLSRIARSAFGIDSNTVERAITVAKSVYKF